MHSLRAARACGITISRLCTLTSDCSGERGCITVARAGLVDEAAFIAALASGRIRHAGLDVFHAEPLSPDKPLARMENVTLTAHAAFRTIEASMTLLRRAIDIVRDIVAKSA